MLFTVTTVLLGLLVVAVVGFFLLAYIACLFEKSPVCLFEEAPQENAGSYLRELIASGQSLGFTVAHFGRHSKQKQIPAVLMQSADRCILVVVAQGRLLGFMMKRTIFISRFADDSLLFSTDESGMGELDPKSTLNVLQNADFLELWQSHYDLIKDRTDFAAFPSKASWNDIEKVYRLRIDRSVEAGRAKYTDLSRSHYRFTHSGFFHGFVLNFVRSISNARNRERLSKARPGDSEYVNHKTE